MNGGVVLYILVVVRDVVVDFQGITINIDWLTEFGFIAHKLTALSVFDRWKLKIPTIIIVWPSHPHINSHLFNLLINRLYADDINSIYTISNAIIIYTYTYAYLSIYTNFSNRHFNLRKLIIFYYKLRKELSKHKDKLSRNKSSNY